MTTQTVFKPQVFKGQLIIAGLNAKTVKGDKSSEYVTAIMYLLPADAVPGVNLCPMAERAGCKAGCLVSAGRGAMSNVRAAREKKTKLYRDNKERFLATLVSDLERFVAWCNKRNVKPAVRLNGTSDIQYERGHPVVYRGKVYPHVFAAFPHVQFYDYTKITQRFKRLQRLPSNYHLTLSYSEANAAYALDVMETAQVFNVNVAFVFRDPETRAKYMECKIDGLPVIDGDKTDLRFLDPRGVIVGLYAKGKAKADQSGFVID